MMVRKFAAGAALTAMVFGAMATPTLAKGNEGKGHGPKITENFQDMQGFEWGLSDVVKLNLSGVFNGRSEHLFAPGAKITHQEVAVAAVRLIGKDAEAQALSKEQVDALLTKFPDEKKLASWARPAVAELIKLNAIAYDAPFAPEEDATRLYTAVLLVKAMGLEAEAQAKMNTTLPFKDANQIPANKVGYVAVAVDHGLITGYVEEGATTFRPNQAVKRIEMAVMMGRADGQLEHKDQLKGIVKSVNTTAGTFVLTVKGQDVTVTLSDDAAVFVNKLVESLSDITVGMYAEVKLNSQGEAIFVDARPATAGDQTGGTTPTPAQTVNGYIVAFASATTTTPAKVTVAVSVNGQTQVTDYALDSTSVIKINGQVAQFADLRVGDQVAISIANQKVTLVAVTRTTVTSVSGQLAAVQAASGTNPAKVTVITTTNGVSTATAYNLASNAQILLNGQASTLANLQINDAVVLTLTNQSVTKIEVTRNVTTTTVSGQLAAVQAASGSTPAKVTVLTTANGVSTATVYNLAASAQILLNGQASTLANLQINDAVLLTLTNQDVTKIEVTRTQVTTVTGVISGMTVAVGSTLPQLNVAVTANGVTTGQSYSIPAGTPVTVNGQAVLFTDLHLGDVVHLTLTNQAVTRVDVTR